MKDNTRCMGCAEMMQATSNRATYCRCPSDRHQLFSDRRQVFPKPHSSSILGQKWTRCRRPPASDPQGSKLGRSKLESAVGIEESRRSANISQTCHKILILCVILSHTLKITAKIEPTIYMAFLRSDRVAPLRRSALKTRLARRWRDPLFLLLLVCLSISFISHEADILVYGKINYVDKDSTLRLID